MVSPSRIPCAVLVPCRNLTYFVTAGLPFRESTPGAAAKICKASRLVGSTNRDYARRPGGRGRGVSPAPFRRFSTTLAVNVQDAWLGGLARRGGRRRRKR